MLSALPAITDIRRLRGSELARRLRLRGRTAHQWVGAFEGAALVGVGCRTLGGLQARPFRRDTPRHRGGQKNSPGGARWRG